MSELPAPSATVYDRLLEWIASGSLLPGTKLVERPLAAQLGVSRIPVRESVARLAAQGLVVGGSRGEGMRLREYSLLEVRQMYEYREMIEGGSARLAAAAASAADLQRLETICEEMSGQVGRPDRSRWIALDRRFHEALAEAGRNDRFIAAMKSLMAECSCIFSTQVRLEKMSTPAEQVAHARKVLREHRRIVTQLRRRDPDGAEHAAREHMRQTVAWVLTLFICRDVQGEQASAKLG